MRKIVIKLPDTKNKKFRLQRKDWKGRRFTTAAGLLNALDRALFPYKLKEKTAIAIKEGKDTSNVSLDSDSGKYLMYCAGCFMEDYLSPLMMKNIEKKYGQV